MVLHEILLRGVIASSELASGLQINPLRATRIQILLTIPLLNHFAFGPNQYLGGSNKNPILVFTELYLVFVSKLRAQLGLKPLMLDDQTHGVTTMAATDSHRTEPVTVSPTPRVSFGSVNDSIFLRMVIHLHRLLH